MTTERRPPALVSVVIPVLNGGATIAAQLEALAKQTYTGAWEVLVSDNGSSDDTIAVAERFVDRLPRLRVLDASQARGVAHARNVGAAAAQDLIAICDADDIVEPGWLEELARAARTADVIGGRLDHDSLNPAWMRGLRGGATNALPSSLEFLPYAIGANFAVRRDVWSALGGWRTEYDTGEDVEFAWRAQLAGYSLAFAPRAVVRYRYREGLRPTYRQVFRYARASAQLYRNYRDRGARRRPAIELARAVGRLSVTLPYLALSRRRRAIWVIGAADVAGSLAGAVAFRTVYW